MRVVNILPHGPFYELLSEHKKPLHEWAMPGGKAVRIVNREWPGQVGHWVLPRTNACRWEVWQPDTRATVPYAHVFDDGIIHRLFPAEDHTFYRGFLRPSRAPFSTAILDELTAQRGQPLIVVLHGFNCPFWYNIVDRLRPRLGEGQDAAIVVMDHGLTVTPIQYLRSSRHPLSFLACIVEQVRARRLYRDVDVVSVPIAESLSTVRTLFKGRTEQVAMGCDFEFWKPVPSEPVKEEIRRRLGIPRERRVFLSVSHFRPVKQLDRLIEAFSRLSASYDFTLLLAGQGDEDYCGQLRSLATSLLAPHQVIFHPYVQGEALRELYWAADVFVSASESEGGPVVTMEATGCGLPVLTTPVGRAYEVMRHHGVGSVLPAGQSDRWQMAIQAILDGGPPSSLDREVARAEFDWRSVSSKVLTILDDLDQQQQTKPRRAGVTSR